MKLLLGFLVYLILAGVTFILAHFMKYQPADVAAWVAIAMVSFVIVHQFWEDTA